jgi:hypothetical protein
MTLQHQSDERWQAIRYTQRRHRDFYELIAGAALVFILIGVGILIFTTELRDYWVNSYVTGIGVALTIFVLDKRSEQCDRRRFHEETVSRLCRELQSRDVATADLALDEIRQRRYDVDGSLQGRWLGPINVLPPVRLYEADLQGASFMGANLQKSEFYASALNAATLIRADLTEADLSQAQLRGANMGGSILFSTRLCGTDLTQAYLINAKVQFIYVDEQTILPDGSRLTKAQMQDISLVDEAFLKFTDPHRDDFFYPNWVTPHKRGEHNIAAN